MSTTEDQPLLIRLGKFGRAHGTHGELRLWAYNPESALYAHPPFDGWAIPQETEPQASPKPVTIEQVRWTERFAIVRLKGVHHRDQADELCHLEFAVGRDELPDPEEDELYLVDTVGWPVWLAISSTQIVHIGHIDSFVDTGANDVVRVALSHGQTLLAPLLDHVVLQLSTESARLVLAPLESWATPGTPMPTHHGEPQPFRATPSS